MTAKQIQSQSRSVKGPLIYPFQRSPFQFLFMEKPNCANKENIRLLVADQNVEMSVFLLLVQ